MKKFLSLVLALLMLIPFSALSVLATDDVPAPQNDEEEAKCTIDKQNIASEAYVTYEGQWFFAINEALINDGSKDQVAHSPKSPSFSWILKFGKPYEITNVDLYVNGTGKCGKCGYEHTADAYSAVKSVQILLYDDLGNEVYKSEPVSLLETNAEGAVMKILEEAKFEFPKVSVSTLIIQGKTDSYGGAYFREVEVYKEIGAHNWVLDEEISIPSTCTSNGKNFYDCECGAEKQERTSKHTVEEWTVIQAPTTTATGMAEGPCIVPGCGGRGSKALDRLILSDTEFPLTMNNFTVTEDVKTGNDMIVTQVPSEDRDLNDLFDGVIETATWQPGNFWCGTGWYSTNYPVDDKVIGMTMAYELKRNNEVIFPADTVIDETVLAKLKELGENEVAIKDVNYSTLTIELDQVYTITMAELYVFSNNNTFSVDFIGADGNSVKLVEKANFECSGGYAKLVFTGEVYGLDVKKIVVTIKSAKWAGGTGLVFTEFKLGAHECLFTDEAIASGTVDGCTTTFSGKCIRCQAMRTDAKVVTHTFEKDPNNPTEDKVTVITEATCFSNGIVTKHCTKCNTDVKQVALATGKHVFDREKVVLAPNCGVTGISYNECSTPGCTAKTEEFSTPTKGEHKYKWEEKEDDKADYTHTGTKVYICEVCNHINEAEGTQESPKADPKIVSSQDWTIRYTDFVSARANFKMNLSKVKEIESEGYTVEVIAVVQKGETKKEIKIYGDGAAENTYRTNGTFSLVVKNAKPSDEFKFSVITLIESTDEAYAEVTTAGKAIAGNNDGTVSVYDVAKYYINNDSRANRLEANYGIEVKDFYASLVEQAGE
ncbi:MAG: hypothetical protein IJW10_03405 [Clostridia bacterium]|nr:hypothetical protein [Clostridia bacterium]